MESETSKFCLCKNNLFHPKNDGHLEAIPSGQEPGHASRRGQPEVSGNLGGFRFFVGEVHGFFFKKPTGDVHGNFSQAASCTTPLKTDSHGTPKKVYGVGRCVSFSEIRGIFLFFRF